MPRIKINGHKLFYADDDFVDPWVPHDVAFLQPYLFGSHEDMSRWVPIVGRNFRVVRLDRFGLGYSEVPAYGYECTLAGMVSDVIGTLDALGLDAVHYVGESVGGVLGVAVAASHPDRVKTLVLANTPCSVNDRVQRLATPPGYPDGPTAVMRMGAWAFSHGMGLLTEAKGPSRAMQLWTARQRSLIPAYMQAALMRMAHDPKFDITDMLQSVQAPTLLISPSDSPVTPLAEQAAMRERIPDCTQTIIDWTGQHWTNSTEPATHTLDFLLKHCTHPSGGDQ